MERKIFFVVDITTWIIGAVAIAFLFGFLLFFFFKNKKKKNQNEKIERSQNVLLALGGEENILSIEAKESRLNIVLKDSSLLNEETLKSLGVSSIVRMSKKTTLVIGRDASQEIADFIQNYQKK